jgi:hypothetical protein
MPEDFNEIARAFCANVDSLREYAESLRPVARQRSIDARSEVAELLGPILHGRILGIEKPDVERTSTAIWDSGWTQ